MAIMFIYSCLIVVSSKH